MEKDNYTLEELTDLLQTQVVLTLRNDGEFYKQALSYIEGRDYDGFRDNTNKRIRDLVSLRSSYLPITRSLVLIWDYYMQGLEDKGNTSRQYLADVKNITENNCRLQAPGLQAPKQDPGAGYVLITPDQAAELRFTAEYYDHISDKEWRPCRSCAFNPNYVYRAPAHVMQHLSPSLPTSPETSKEITMTQTTCQFDASIPVTNVTLIYGESDLLTCVRRLDADIETYSKSGADSKRFAAKVATMKAEREQIIKAFDAAADTAVGTTSDSASV